MNATFLRRSSIQTRLYLLIAIVSITLMVPLVLALVDYQQSLIAAKKTKTRHLVESAYSLVDHYHQQQLSGQLSQQQAQAAAAKAIQSLRYEGNDYFWINDLTPTMVMHPINPN